MTDVTAPCRAQRRTAAKGSRRGRATRGRATHRSIRYCLGPGLMRAVRGATANVERHVPELNALNVYPVPDGDTGVNMIATMRAALAEAERLAPEQASLHRLAEAIAFGALMGARGNSGVILSQVFRGMAESVAGKGRADARDLADALAAGTRTAYAALARPVEGTILTVVREAAAAAQVAADDGASLGEALAIATEAARRAVARTPEQLDVLREAGVVDAGGQGLFRALEGALEAMSPVVREPVRHAVGAKRRERGGAERAGAEDRDGAVEPGAGAPTVAPTTMPNAPEGTWGYETVFLIHGRGALEPEAIRDRFEAIGESVLVAGDRRMVKVHVHNQRPDEVIAVGLSLGVLSQVTVQNLDEQTGEARRHWEDGGVAAADPPPVAPAGDAPAASTPAARLAVVAVAGGPGLAEVFASFGVDEILPSPRVGNPSTGEIVEALQRIDATGILVLPNDPNVVLAAEQAASATPGKEVVVVPTRSAPEGFAALLAMDHGASAGENLGPMLAAARDVRTLLVARADRDSRLGGRDIAAGQYIALRPGEGLVAVADDAVSAIDSAVAGLDDGFELLTFYIGEGGSAEEAGEAIRRIVERRPGTEAEVLPGGQPHYPYLISAE
jgi:hypothetical protein